MEETKEKSVGRPRKHKDERARVSAWRQKQERRRLDIYVDSSTSWRIDRLANEWGCSLSAVVERLTIEADEKYSNILFPETE